MEDRNNVSNQVGQGQGNKPGQGGSQQGGREGQIGQQGGREGQGGTSDKPFTRPTPSGVPNEGRGTGSNQSGETLGAMMGNPESDYAYKGGRQETGGIPNPDDADDRDSAGSFRGTAELATDGDEAENEGDDEAGGEDEGADDDEDDGDQTIAAQNRNSDPNSQVRNPE